MRFARFNFIARRRQSFPSLVGSRLVERAPQTRSLRSVGFCHTPTKARLDTPIKARIETLGSTIPLPPYPYQSVHRNIGCYRTPTKARLTIPSVSLSKRASKHWMLLYPYQSTPHYPYQNTRRNVGCFHTPIKARLLTPTKARPATCPTNVCIVTLGATIPLPKHASLPLPKPASKQCVLPYTYKSMPRYPYQSPHRRIGCCHTPTKARVKNANRRNSTSKIVQLSATVGRFAAGYSSLNIVQLVCVGGGGGGQHSSLIFCSGGWWFLQKNTCIAVGRVLQRFQKGTFFLGSGQNLKHASRSL